MSWLDRVKDKMVVTTGDGLVHRPEWMNASYVVEYNHTEFNFIGVEGGLVKRKKPIGIKYNLEILFQGPDHIELADRFRISSDTNEGPWLIQHPLYGDLTVQPTTLTYDNSGHNVSRITGVVIATMEEPPRNNAANPRDAIPALVEETTELSSKSLTVLTIPGDINTLSKANDTVYKKGLPIIQDATNYEAFHNAFNTAATYIDTLTATPLLAMTSMITVLQLPGQFVAGVRQRLKVLIDTFNSLRNNLLGIVAVSTKQIHTAQQCGLMAAICQAAATPQTGDYTKSADVMEVIDDIGEVHEQLIDDIDTLQSVNAGSPQSFVADAELLIKINQLVNLTITNLFTIALGARQERKIVCEKETNPISLAHRLYGLDPSDANINQLMSNNDLAVDEIVIIEKGREILYYV